MVDVLNAREIMKLSFGSANLLLLVGVIRSTEMWIQVDFNRRSRRQQERTYTIDKRQAIR